MISQFVVNNYYQVKCHSLTDMEHTNSTDSNAFVFDHVTDLYIDGVQVTLSPTDEVRIIIATASLSGEYRARYVVRVVNDFYYLFDNGVETKNADYITFVGKAKTIPSMAFSFYENRIPYITLLHDSDLAMFINFYKFNGERDMVDKSSNLTGTLTISGQLTEDCDILNPSILLQYDNDTDPLFDYNYCNIPLFKRYYWITKIVAVRKGLWRVDLHVDVLYTYDTDIYNQMGFVERNEDISLENSLIDNRLPVKDIKTIKYVDIDETGTGTLKNIDFDFSDVTNGYKFTLKVYNDVTWISTPYDLVAPVSDLPDIPNLTHQNASLYLLDNTAMANVVIANSRNSAGASNIISMMYLPCDLHTLYGFIAAPNNKIYSGNYILDIEGGEITWCPTPHSSGYEPVGYHVEYSATPYLVLADFEVDNALPYDIGTYPDLAQWINLSPNTEYYLYIPFVSYVKINMIDVIGCRLLLMYNIDYDTGMGSAILYNYTKKKIVYSSQAQIGIQIAINTTNNYEVTKQKQNNMLNFSLGLLASSYSLAFGVASGKGNMVLGGALGIGKSIASYINADNMLYEQAQVSIGGSITSLYFPVTKPHWKVVYSEPLQTDLDDFFHLNGKVCKCYDSLSNFTGYTEVSIMHYTPSSQTYITTTEISEIEELAKNGIIL